jgi:hypothetical protein
MPSSASNKPRSGFSNATAHGTRFPTAPIGLYFARLWYHERLYPVIWTLGALHTARQALLREKH